MNEEATTRRGVGRLARRLWDRPWLVVLLLTLVGFVLLAVIPFAVPVPPASGTVPPEELAGPGGRFVEVEGITIHYQQWGDGGEGLPVVLLHGFGASTFSWREVAAELARERTVIAFDRPGFGLSERPLAWRGENPYGPEGQATLTLALLDVLGIDRAILVGHSAGGRVAALVSQRQPERVAGLVLVAPALGGDAGPASAVAKLARLPQVDHLGPLLVRSLTGTLESILERSFHDPAKLTPQIRAGYRLPLRARDWDRGLWEIVKAPAGPDVRPGLSGLRQPVLVITGDDDRIVPPAQSVEAARVIPGAELVVIRACGHLPQEEQPQAFLETVVPFVSVVRP